MKTGIRLQDIAESLNLSISTVSKSINDSPEISSKTKKRVKELAALKQYIPNSSAQNLKGRKTKIIGIIIPNIYSRFYAEALKAIESRIAERGYQIIVSFSNESLNKEIECVEKLIQIQVDGIVISPSNESLMINNLNHLERVSYYNISLVIFDRILDNINCDKVGLNQNLLVEESTLELHNLGFRRICYLASKAEGYSFEQRKKGYFDAIKTTGGPNLFVDFNKKNTIERKINKIIESKDMDCIIVSDEFSTLTVVKCAFKLGFQIPNDFGLLSLSNENFNEFLHPSLSTMNQKGEEQGKIAADMVLDRIEGKLPAESLQFILKALLNHRDSTSGKWKLSTVS